MIGWVALRRFVVVGSSVVLTATGCAFQGLNSLPLPGAVGRGSDAAIYHVEIANVGALESNSPVMINDVVVGSVGKMTVQGWHANVEVSLNKDVVARPMWWPVSGRPAFSDRCISSSIHRWASRRRAGCSPAPRSR